MKIKKGFEVRTVCGEHLIMAMGEDNVDFSNVVTLNESSLFLWKKMESGVDTIDALVECIMQEYEIDAATARKDIIDLIDTLVGYGVVEK